jgi:hypothetical protein
VEVRAVYNIATGQMMTSDITTLAPLTGEYASVAGWYVNDEPITIRGNAFRRSARPRILDVREVAKVDEFGGVGVYAAAADTSSASWLVYLPTRPGCEFQPYMHVDSVAAARR